MPSLTPPALLPCEICLGTGRSVPPDAPIDWSDADSIADALCACCGGDGRVALADVEEEHLFEFADAPGMAEELASRGCTAFLLATFPNGKRIILGNPSDADATCTLLRAYGPALRKSAEPVDPHRCGGCGASAGEADDAFCSACGWSASDAHSARVA